MLVTKPIVIGCKSYTYDTHYTFLVLLNKKSLTPIIVAAHCFARNNRGNALNPPSRYKVGAGKYYLSYLDSRDTMAQYSEVYNHCKTFTE